MIPAIIGIVVVVAIAIAIAGIYNNMVTLRNRIDNAWQNIDTQLQRRNDMIPNLVETVKGYAAHEKETLDAVVSARNAAASATTPDAKMDADNLLTGALRQLFAVAEAYPDLKANANFSQLQTSLEDTENKILLRAPELQRLRPQLQQRHPDLPRQHLRRHLPVQGAHGLRGGRGRARGPAGQVLAGPPAPGFRRSISAQKRRRGPTVAAPPCISRATPPVRAAEKDPSHPRGNRWARGSRSDRYAGHGPIRHRSR